MSNYFNICLLFNQIQAVLGGNHVSTLSGLYWSSTVGSGDPTNDAWIQDFALSGGTNQYDGNKGYPLGARCSRALTLYPFNGSFGANPDPCGT